MARYLYAITCCFAVLSVGCSAVTSEQQTLAPKPSPEATFQEIKVKKKVEQKMQESLQTSRGYTLKEMAVFRPYMLSKCTWCADYVKKKRGFVTGDESPGTRKRACNPEWDKLCAPKVTMGDGSIWELTGNCRCNEHTP